MSRAIPNTAVLPAVEAAGRPRAAERCVHHLFESQAARTPEAIALTHGDCELTYRELDERSNRLAHYLRGLGVGPEILVAVVLNRSPELVVGLLGVLKAGGAYVPLDPSYPAERLAFMLADAGAPVLLTSSDLLGRLPQHEAYVVRVDRDADAIAKWPSTSPDGGAAPDNLAYVIYTSGSTGFPKGAMIVHRGLSNYLIWAARAYGVTGGVGAPIHSSVAFDLTVTSLFLPLLVGRRVDLLDEGQGVESLAEALRQSSDYSLVKITPAHLQLLGRQIDPEEAAGRTRAFVVGGEQLTAEHVTFWREHAPETLIINEYGPTETVVGCCVYTLPSEGSTAGAFPIGRPIARTRLYVLDGLMQPVPFGVVGELYIGGAGVARGYLGRPSLTSERFVPDPFADGPGARLYRSGDLARRRPDGMLEFLGRADDQVKIRGHRIEPGEVESALARHPVVRGAAVVAREDRSGDRRLVAYLTVEPGRESPSTADLRAFLGRTLPAPMIPSAFVVADALPLTPNGKVDRTSLPAPEGDRPDLGVPFEAPRTSAEEAVARAWADVLGVGRVGVRDNFFDLGGHSLLATQVASRLREALGVEVPVRLLFEAPTVAALARRLSAGSAALAPPIRRVRREGPIPPSFAQESLWYLDQLAPGQPTFNVSAAIRVVGPLDVEALRGAFREVVRRHEALRTTFASVDGRLMQVIAPSLDVPLEVVDLSPLAPEARRPEAERRAEAETRRPFDLADGPLFRATLFRVDDEDNIVLLVMHHIITDGWSFGVAASELGALYGALREGHPSPLPELAIRYADYSIWQREWLRGDVKETLLDYWRRHLDGVRPLELPTDRPRPTVRSSRGDLRQFELPSELSESILDLGRRGGRRRS
jgi:amino acid adenylation domain-containing protein